uniref:TRI27 protein n=1 Tax=Cyanoderma ruficeps TaxID=181631 RepID=A0A8C3RIJ3_9PASS
MKAAPPSSPGLPMDALPGEASCPICLEYFRDPVSIHCGHHFCRGCIERCWEWPTAGFACPRCRDTAPQRSLRPSRELARVLEIARRLSRGEALGTEEEDEEEGCLKHREPLEVFCKEDGALLCAICRESRSHRAHTVLPLPEVVREYRVRGGGFHPAPPGQKCTPSPRRGDGTRSGDCALSKTEAERQRVLSQFQGLRVSLEELSRHLLARLRDLEGDIGKAQEENVTSLTKEISRLDTRVQELEEKCRQPARTFLQVTTRGTRLVRKENLQLPPSPLPELEERIHRFREEYVLLEETLRGFQGIGSRLGDQEINFIDRPGTETPPDQPGADTETPPDGPGADTETPPDGPGPGTDPSVLGRQGVTAGRRCWDVRVAPAGSWALGVARESPGSGAETPGSGAETPGSPEWELWSMGLCQGQFWALTSLERIPLFPARAPSRVRVALDYERGQVAFFDAEKKSLIFAFPAASFKGQRVRPWFLVWGEGSRITLCP